jgi:2-polyprenyl-6-methoxyphenol hydroxylase-like FAD-dependent oxidoreductase
LCKILEQRSEIDQHSKSLGIHPVSLELFDDLGIVESFIQEGLKIQYGHAFTDNKKVGTISFKDCAPPFNYILSLPQHKTERILEGILKNLDPDCLIRGAEVKNIHQHQESVAVTCMVNGETKELNTKWLAGCDGKHSLIRKKAEIEFQGKHYPDTYVMGDFTDNTDFGADAAVYLHRDGLVESFPLPEGERRWVIKTEKYVENPGRKIIDNLLMNRLNFDITNCEMSMISSFGVQHFLSETLYKNRILLAGDSAHVVSPIGGQGMNLGWMTAQNLGRTLIQVIKEPVHTNRLLRIFSARSRSVARQTGRRAEINMLLGRKQRFPYIRRLLIKGLVNTPISRLFARVFTMRGLGKWPI